MHHETPPIEKMTFPTQTSLLKTLRPLPENSMSLPMDQAMHDATPPQEEPLALRAPPREKASTVVRTAIASGPAANSADARKNKKKRNSKSSPSANQMANANDKQKTQHRQTS